MFNVIITHILINNFLTPKKVKLKI